MFFLYDSQISNVSYDDVLHNLCCMPSQNNIANWEKMISFIALKEKKWIYVEAALYE